MPEVEKIIMVFGLQVMFGVNAICTSSNGAAMLLVM